MDRAVVDRIVWALYAVCAGLVALDAVAWLTDVPYHKHGHYDWEVLPGFHAAYGFVACVVLVLAARVLRTVVMRGEDYYDA